MIETDMESGLRCRVIKLCVIDVSVYFNNNDHGHVATDLALPASLET